MHNPFTPNALSKLRDRLRRFLPAAARETERPTPVARPIPHAPVDTHAGPAAGVPTGPLRELEPAGPTRALHALYRGLHERAAGLTSSPLLHGDPDHTYPHSSPYVAVRVAPGTRPQAGDVAWLTRLFRYCLNAAGQPPAGSVWILLPQRTARQADCTHARTVPVDPAVWARTPHTAPALHLPIDPTIPLAQQPHPPTGPAKQLLDAVDAIARGHFTTRAACPTRTPDGRTHYDATLAGLTTSSGAFAARIRLCIDTHGQLLAGAEHGTTAAISFGPDQPTLWIAPTVIDHMFRSSDLAHYLLDTTAETPDPS